MFISLLDIVIKFFVLSLVTFYYGLNLVFGKINIEIIGGRGLFCFFFRKIFFVFFRIIRRFCGYLGGWFVLDDFCF